MTICYIENFGVLLKKNEKLTILMLIFSYEAVKYQKVSLYIMKGLPFAFPENTAAFTYDSQSCIFFLTPKISPERSPFNSCHST